MSAAGKKKSIYSCVADAPVDDLLGGFFRPSPNDNSDDKNDDPAYDPGYLVRIIAENENDTAISGEYLVGKAASKSPYATPVNLSPEKQPEIHDILLLSAAYLVGAGAPAKGSTAGVSNTRLAVGLPLAFYKHQRHALKSRLEALAARVQINGGEERRIDFSRVMVLPQGAGIVLVQNSLPEDGSIVLVVQAGTYTTEYILLEVKDGQPVPIEGYHNSLTTGLHLVHRAVAAEYQRLTGEPLDQARHAIITDQALKGKPIMHNGKPLDLTPTARRAAIQTGKQVANLINSRLSHMRSSITTTYVAGGAGMVFKDQLLKMLPAAELTEDPLFDDCKGYLYALQEAEMEAASAAEATLKEE